MIKKAWQWIGHTLRRTDGSIAKAALELNPQRKRRRGRPNPLWGRTGMAERKRAGKLSLLQRKLRKTGLAGKRSFPAYGGVGLCSDRS